MTYSDYENEAQVGDGVARLDRELVFVTTKYEGYAYTDKLGRFNKGPLEECRASLDRLGLDYIDLYLIHSPRWVGDSAAVVKAWKEMEYCVANGWVKSIGVSK